MTERERKKEREKERKRDRGEGVLSEVKRTIFYLYKWSFNGNVNLGGGVPLSNLFLSKI